MTLSPIRRFWNLLKQYKPELRQIYACAVFIGIVNLTLPLGIQAIINFIQTGEMTSSWIVLVCFVLIGIAVTGMLQVLQLRIVENIQQDLFARSAFEFAYRIPRITFVQLDKTHAPELVNRFFDTLTIQKGLPKILIDFSLAIFQITFGLLLLAVYSSYFIILGFVLVVILWLIFKITGPKGLDTALKESKYKYNMAHWLEEIARVNRSFKLNLNGDLHLRKTDDGVVNYVIAREKHFRILIGQFQLFIAFKVILAAGLLILGGILVFQNQMDIGQFVAAEIVIILIINSVEKVLRIIDTIYDVLTALEKIGFVTDMDLDKNIGTALVEGDTAMSVKAIDIEFGFEGENSKIIDNLSFNVPANGKVVVSGKSGSGKSILLQIIAGIHTIQGGTVYINSIPFLNYQRDKLYDNLGVAFPTNQLFEGTFRENIAMGKEISDKKAEEILNVLGLSEYFAHQVKGVDTQVDSGGRRLPGTIIRKLLLARILIKEPKLLLLEEPLQSVAVEERNRIVDYIMDEKRNWTVFVVSDYPRWQEKSTQTLRLG